MCVIFLSKDTKKHNNSPGSICSFFIQLIFIPKTKKHIITHLGAYVLFPYSWFSSQRQKKHIITHLGAYVLFYTVDIHPKDKKKHIITHLGAYVLFPCSWYSSQRQKKHIITHLGAVFLFVRMLSFLLSPVLWGHDPYICTEVSTVENTDNKSCKLWKTTRQSFNLIPAVLFS